MAASGTICRSSMIVMPLQATPSLLRQRQAANAAHSRLRLSQMRAGKSGWQSHASEFEDKYLT